MTIKQVIVSGKLQAELQSMELDERLEADEFPIRTERTFISAGTELAIYTGREAGAPLPAPFASGGAIWMQRFYAPAGRVPNNNFSSSIKLKRLQPILS